MLGAENGEEFARDSKLGLNPNGTLGGWGRWGSVLPEPLLSVDEKNAGNIAGEFLGTCFSVTHTPGWDE